MHFHLSSICHKCLDTLLSIFSGPTCSYVVECILVNVLCKPTVLSVPLFLTQDPRLFKITKLLLVYMTNEKKKGNQNMAWKSQPRAKEYCNFNALKLKILCL